MTDDTLEKPAEDIDALQADAEQQAEPITVESLAAEKGWSPKEKWRGAPDKWKPADEFIRATFDINDQVRRELKSTKDTVEKLARTSATITADRIAAATREIEARFADAVEAGDVKGAKAATEELRRVEAQAKPEPENAVADFMDRNKGWYEKDDEATALAVSVSNRLAGQGKSQAEQVEAAEAAVRKFKPELFGDADKTPAGRRAPLVNEPGSRSSGTSNRAKGVADLPPSAVRAGQDFVKKGLVPDMATYAKSWHAENAA